MLRQKDEIPKDFTYLTVDRHWQIKQIYTDSAHQTAIAY